VGRREKEEGKIVEILRISANGSTPRKEREGINNED